MRALALITLSACAMLSSARLDAQVQSRVSNFATTSNGFTVTLGFRNAQGYGASSVLYPMYLRAGVSARLDAHCRSVNLFYGCTLRFPTTRFVGPVQSASFESGGTRFIGDAHYWVSEDSCAGGCWFKRYGSGGAFGLLGCALPDVGGVAAFYGVRTCDADGFTGWIEKDFTFTIEDFPGGPPLAFTLDESDFVHSFDENVFNRVQAVPEPATLTMLGAGLAILCCLAGRRSRRPTP